MAAYKSDRLLCVGVPTANFVATTTFTGFHSFICSLSSSSALSLGLKVLALGLGKCFYLCSIATVQTILYVFKAKVMIGFYVYALIFQDIHVMGHFVTAPFNLVISHFCSLLSGVIKIFAHILPCCIMIWRYMRNHGPGLSVIQGRNVYRLNHNFFPKEGYL